MPKKKSVKKSVEKKEESKPAPVVVEVTETTVEPGKKKMIFTLKKKVWTYVGVLVLVGAVAVPGLYYYQQYDKAQAQLHGASATGDAAVIEAVSKLYDLPAGEIPTVATVSDIQALKKSEGYTPFFAKAANGDKVLVYQASGRAILYRPSSNKILEVSPLNAGQAQAQPQQSVAGESTTASGSAHSTSSGQSKTEESTPTPSPQPVKVTVLNGTKKAGLAKKAASQVSSLNNVTVISTGNAVNNQEKTIVVDLTGKNSSTAYMLSTALGVGEESKKLPEGERESTSDIIIILGTDYKE